jgi:hypothetical protein
MRIFSLFSLYLLSFTCIILVSCDEKEEFVSEPLTAYMPMTVGKYITYRVDSLVFTQFGTVDETHYYRVKHQVDAQITDNLGRPAYRVFRYISDSSGTQPWQASGSYTVTLDGMQAEVTEDNLRVIKLHLPLKEGFSWRGNRYLPTDPYGPLYTFSNDDNMEEWDFQYEAGPTSFTYKGRNYSNVFTVEQIDEVLNVPITVPTSYAAKTRSVDRYSRGIGLVFRQFEIWEYQPPLSGGPNKTGFGITMWMVDHN